MQIGEKIRKERLNQGCTILDLAKRSNLTRATISNIENGKTSPMDATLLKIASSLGITIEQLKESTTCAVKRDLTLGINMRYLRYEYGYTQKKLAEICGFPITQIFSYERGMAVPPQVKLLKIAQVLGTTPKWLQENHNLQPITAVHSKIFEPKKMPTAEGQFIRDLRISLLKTQKEFAEEVGISSVNLSRIECGRQLPRRETLAKISKFSGFPISYFLQ